MKTNCGWTFLSCWGTLAKLISFMAIKLFVRRFTPRKTSPKVPLPKLLFRFQRILWSFILKRYKNQWKYQNVYHLNTSYLFHEYSSLTFFSPWLVQFRFRPMVTVSSNFLLLLDQVRVGTESSESSSNSDSWSSIGALQSLCFLRVLRRASSFRLNSSLFCLAWMREEVPLFNTNDEPDSSFQRFLLLPTFVIFFKQPLLFLLKCFFFLFLHGAAIKKCSINSIWASENLLVKYHFVIKR